MRAQSTPSARHTRIVGTLLPLVWAVGVCATLVAQTPTPSGQPPTSPPPASPAGVPPAGAPADAKPPAEGQAPPEAVQPAAPAPTVVTSLKFTTPAGMLLASIKPDKTADYEALLAAYVESLKNSDDPSAKQMAEGLRAYKATEPAPAGSNVLYVLLFDPVAPDGNYSWQALMERVYAAAPDQAKTIFEKATTVHGGAMNKVSLTPVSLTPAPAAPADAPAAQPAVAEPKKPSDGSR